MAPSPPVAKPRPSRFRFARQHPGIFLGICFSAGVLATTGLLWLFLAIAEGIPERSALVRMDVATARWIETHRTERGDSIFFSVSILGAPVLVACIVAALIYCVARRERLEAIALVFATGTGLVFSEALKLIFHRGRPANAAEFLFRQSWSFPSSHAMNSLIGYGFLAVLALTGIRERRRRMAVVVVTVLLVVAIGFSRLYLGVHYLSDVAGGWLAGGAWFIICAAGYREMTERTADAKAAKPKP